MSRYEVDAAQLSSTAVAVQSSASTVEDAVAGMHRTLVALQGTWQGTASAQFAGLVTQWHTAAAQLDRALRQLVGAVQSAAITYDDAESQATRLFTAG